ncbi:hypothetical protein VDGD_09846 [Verticillium dahliae]|nr:hypothetical protein VDGD_09846 [Verticillium dahliae]
MKAGSSLLLSVGALAGLVGTSSGAAVPADPRAILKPVPKRPGIEPNHGQGIAVRAAADVPSVPELAEKPAPVILSPIPRANILSSKLGNGLKLKTRQESVTPVKDLVLGYAGSEMTALVDIALKQPAVALEEVDGVSSVKCQDSSVTINFNDLASLQAATAAWPKELTVLTYSPDDGCNPSDERGWFALSDLVFDNAKLVATASSKRTSLNDEGAQATVNFDTNPAPDAKRDLKSLITPDIAGTLANLPDLKINIDEARFESKVQIAGSFGFNFLDLKASSMSLDIDYSSLIALNLSAHVGAAYSTDVFDFEPFTASISAFSIPGILDVGPIVSFGIGVEFAAEGTVDASLGLHSEIPAGKIHLNLANSDKSSTSGWEPVTTMSSDLNAEVSLQLNPYLDLNLAVGVQAFKRAIDLTAGVDLKPQVVNAWSADANFEYTSKSGIALARPEGVTCPNGAWFASTFKFDIVAYIANIYSKVLYEYDHPLYKSSCWNFA